MWDIELVSEVEINFNMIVFYDYGSRPSACWELTTMYQDIKLTTLIPEKIFRIRDIKLVFNTYNAKNGKKNVDYAAIFLG